MAQYLVDIDGCLVDTARLHSDAYARTLDIHPKAMELMYPAIAHLKTNDVLVKGLDRGIKKGYAFQAFTEYLNGPRPFPDAAIGALRKMRAQGRVYLWSNAQQLRQLLVKERLYQLYGIAVSIMPTWEYSSKIDALCECDDRIVVLDDDYDYVDIVNRSGEGNRGILTTATEEGWECASRQL